MRGCMLQPAQLSKILHTLQELLGSCQADILELESIIYGLLTFEIQPSEWGDVLLERLAASLQTAPSCSPEKDAEILSDLIQLYLFGTPNNSSYMRPWVEEGQGAETVEDVYSLSVVASLLRAICEGYRSPHQRAVRCAHLDRNKGPLFQADLAPT
eukprot:1161378-Pelagomonas_calceolata.AAC.1